MLIHGDRRQVVIRTNTLLQALIEDSGVSRAGLAARVNTITGRSYDHRSVGRWMRGERPRQGVPEAIAAALSEILRVPICVEDIGMGTPDEGPYTELARFTSQAPALWRADESGTPDASFITGLDAIAPIWEWESPPEDRDVSRDGLTRVGLAEVLHLRSVRSHYEHMYRAVGGITVRPRIAAYLANTVTPMLRGSYDHTTGRQLYRAIGGLVAVAGICAYDCDDQGLAQQYFHQALRLAKASGDRGFGGYVVALLVNQALHRRDYKQAVAFAEAALRTAGPHLSPALATDFHSMQAKAFAQLRDQKHAHASMRNTEAAADRIRRSEEPPETGYVQPGLVETKFAESFISLGDFHAARRYADLAVTASDHSRGRVHSLATVTQIAIQTRELDRAAAACHATLDHAAGMESRRLFERFGQLRASMQPFQRTAALRDVRRTDRHGAHHPAGVDADILRTRRQLNESPIHALAEPRGTSDPPLQVVPAEPR